MTAADATATCRRTLETALATGLDAVALSTLGAAPAESLDAAFRDFAREHGAAALPLLTALAERSGTGLRRAARRALYRLAQRGVTAPTAPPARPVVERRPERAVRAWMSGIDGSGSRAVWVLFETAYGGLALCSLILNDTAGILDVAGGDISRKRLERELAALRAEQKLPWLDVAPERAVGLVHEAIARHRALGTAPPSAFARWERMFAAAPGAARPDAESVDPALAERAAELLELPDLAGWFLDPEAVQSDAVDVLQTRESRLVVSDQIKTEREEAILARVVEREFPPEVRARWAARLLEMALVFGVTTRPEPAAIARAAAAALADPARDVTRDVFARALARRGLEYAGEVAAGRVSAADVSRKPGAATGRA